MGFEECFNRPKLIALTTLGCFSYYNALYANFQVVNDYIMSKQYGYFVVTILAILFSLLAQTFYSKKLSIYENISFYIASLLSFIYFTPLYIFVLFMKWQCEKGIDNSKKYEMYTAGDMEKIGLITNFFEAPILVCIQIHIIGQFILYSSQTMELNNINYPSNNREFAWLLYAAITSFKGLSDGAWTRICDMISGCDGSVDGRSKTCRTILFRMRAFIETLIRALRFMMVSSIYGGIFGFGILIIEVLWKWSLLSCCCCITNKIRGNKNKLSFGFKVYAVATWMVFSHERFQNWPYFMRILDIFVWTSICISISILGIFYHYSLPKSLVESFVGNILNKIEMNGICHEFGMFKRDCYPIEILLIIGLLLIILAVIYKLSPSIFLLLEKSKEQKLSQMQQQEEEEQQQQASRGVELTMNEPGEYIQSQRSMLNTMNSNYLNQQQAMIQTMNEAPAKYIESQMCMIEAMNNVNNPAHTQQIQEQQRLPSLSLNYLNQQQAMIQTMNGPPSQNYIQSQMAMLDTMNNHQPN